MTINYKAISEQNEKRFGTDIGRYGGPLLVDRYEDRTHFIFELIQNAEDALKRRGSNWSGSKNIQFELENNKLKFSHFGHPFTENDVRSICSIAESTKGDDAIGKFGIGFKSVYTFTDSPEIHSGNEHFSIKNYVHPESAEKIENQLDETQIILPLRKHDIHAKDDLKKGLTALGANALLFLRQIEELNWSIDGKHSGFYLRTKPQVITSNISRIKLIGESENNPDVDQEWLVATKKLEKGMLEIAFSLKVNQDNPNTWEIVPLDSSPLIVFFPTACQTNLGFLIQGPFECTPSRDNIKLDSSWNRYLIDETAKLLVDTLMWLKAENRLTLSTLRCLPLQPNKFTKDSLFFPIYDAVKKALSLNELLPSFDNKFVCAEHTKLARTQEIRELFSPAQASILFGADIKSWLSGDITQDKSPDIRQYTINVLGIEEITPEKLIQRMTLEFLEAQTNEWILKLYEFLQGRQDVALRRLLEKTPIIRLFNGKHVLFKEKDKINVFLPSNIKTSFPTIHHEVCSSEKSLSFLKSLHITEPDLVDDVIWNVLPKYHSIGFSAQEEEYNLDINHILLAFKTDSNAQKEKLKSVLRDTSFIKSKNCGDDSSVMAKPNDVYIATDKLKKLFTGVHNVLMVDDTYNCLRGEDMRSLLEACGSSRYLSTIKITSRLTEEELLAIRRDAGLERASWEEYPEDYTLRGLTELLNLLPNLTPTDAKIKSDLLWDSLCDLESRNSNALYGSYKWGYFREEKTARFDADFIRVLNERSWIINSDDKLVTPYLINFNSLEWKSNPLLLSKIIFKPELIDQLAKEIGIDPAALDVLRQSKITADQLKSLLGLTSTNDKNNHPVKELDNVFDELNDLYGDEILNSLTTTLDDDDDKNQRDHDDRRETNNKTKNDSSHSKNGKGSHDKNHNNKQPNETRSRTFVSYISTQPIDEEFNPENLHQDELMKIESDAIKLIREMEPQLKTTLPYNKGFDLYETCENGIITTKWVEVKSMSGNLENHPVALSQAQFKEALVRGANYWLYVVENVGKPNCRLIKIQNPARRGKYFTFDKGWIEVAEIVQPKNLPSH